MCAGPTAFTAAASRVTFYEFKIKPLIHLIHQQLMAVGQVRKINFGARILGKTEDDGVDCLSATVSGCV